MSNTHVDNDGFHYDGDLLDLINDNDVEIDDLDDLVVIALTKTELSELGAFIKAIITMAPSLERSAPAVVQQVIDFAHEAGRE